MHRKWLLRVVPGVVLPVLLPVAFLLLWRCWLSPKARLSRVKPGMSMAEVEAVLGPPDLPAGYHGPDFNPPITPQPKYEMWAWGTTAVVVYFDDDDRALGVDTDMPKLPAPPTWYDRVRDRLGW